MTSGILRKLSLVRVKMRLNRSWQIRLAQISLGAALVIALVVVRGTSAQNDPVHMATDWSHEHLVFSAPKTLVGRFQASSDSRYVQQWVRRNAEKKANKGIAHSEEQEADKEVEHEDST